MQTKIRVFVDGEWKEKDWKDIEIYKVEAVEIIDTMHYSDAKKTLWSLSKFSKVLMKPIPRNELKVGMIVQGAPNFLGENIPTKIIFINRQFVAFKPLHGLTNEFTMSIEDRALDSLILLEDVDKPIREVTQEEVNEKFGEEVRIKN